MGLRSKGDERKERECKIPANVHRREKVSEYWKNGLVTLTELSVGKLILEGRCRTVSPHGGLQMANNLGYHWEYVTD